MMLVALLSCVAALLGTGVLAVGLRRRHDATAIVYGACVAICLTALAAAPTPSSASPPPC